MNILFFLVSLLSFTFAQVHAEEKKTVVPLEDTTVVLHNPDMGWVLYENYPVDHRPTGSSTLCDLPQALFEGCDAVAIMFAWSDIEKEPGIFDWSRVDTAWQFWIKRGKSIHLRISSEPLFGWSKLTSPGGLGIPDWLLEKIPEDQKKLRNDNSGFGWHVDARNKLYQERLRHFLKETKLHFSGDRLPALIDLRGFGRWGEWHTGYPYKSLEEKRTALQFILDIWCDAFPDQMLAMSYSHDPDGPAELYAGPSNKLDPTFTTNYADYLRYSAFDLALKKNNITLRRDGVGGAVYSNQRKLCKYVYRELRRAPQMSEFLCGYAQSRNGGPEWLNWLVDDALSLHPNYISLLGYGAKDAQNFMRERPDLIAHGLRHMGYRLALLNATFPNTIREGKNFIIEMDWVNRAAGRALRDYELRVCLANEKGSILAQTSAGTIPTSKWLQGEKQKIRAEVLFPEIGAGGEAIMLISLFDKKTGKNICLPLVNRTADESCKLGLVLISP